MKARDYVRKIAEGNGDKEVVAEVLTTIVANAIQEADRHEKPQQVISALRNGHQMWRAVAKPFVEAQETASTDGPRMQDMYVRALASANPYLLALVYMEDFPGQGRATSDPDQRSRVFHGYTWAPSEMQILQPLIAKVLGSGVLAA